MYTIHSNLIDDSCYIVITVYMGSGHSTHLLSDISYGLGSGKVKRSQMLLRNGCL